MAFIGVLCTFLYRDDPAGDDLEAHFGVYPNSPIPNSRRIEESHWLAVTGTMEF